MVGSQAYPQATALLITADAGGSNGHRSRLWKVELAELAARTELDITVCHFPPGTSKWNKIEHRLFSYISLSWRGRPITGHGVVVNLMDTTSTATGLKVRAERHPHLPAWHQDRGQGVGCRTPGSPRLSRDVELHHHQLQPTGSALTSNHVDLRVDP